MGIRCSQWRALSARSSGRQKRKAVSILLQMCFLRLFIVFRVRIVHQMPLCTWSLGTKLLTQKHPYAQLPSRKPRHSVIQPSFFCWFFWSTTCHSRGCAAVSDNHSYQLPTTLNPGTKFCAFSAAFAVCLVSPKFQIPCSESERWYSSTTQSVHKFAHNCIRNVPLSKCLQMMGQHRPTRVHTERHADSVFVWVMSKNPWHSSPRLQRRHFVHQLHSDTFLCH